LGNEGNTAITRPLHYCISLLFQILVALLVNEGKTAITRLLDRGISPLSRHVSRFGAMRVIQRLRALFIIVSFLFPRHVSHYWAMRVIKRVHAFSIMVSLLLQARDTLLGNEGNTMITRPPLMVSLAL